MVKVRKSESYSKLMLEEGAMTPVDIDPNFSLELPDWADEKKIKMGQRFCFWNLDAFVRAVAIGFIAIASTETILKVLMSTKMSSTTPFAYRRYKANRLHLTAWYRYPIKPGTIAWKSLENVRRMHFISNKKSTKAEVGIISQKDMAVTQFLFMGFNILMPDEFGIVGTREQFEAFNHLWRLLGYLLGQEDRFNACGETLEETRSRLQSIKEDMLRPSLAKPCLEYEEYSRVVVNALWYPIPTLHYESLIFMIKRAVEVPGYSFSLFKTSSKNEKLCNEEYFANLSFYSKFRVVADIIVYEHLCKFFLVRCLLNLLRAFTGLLELYPLLPVLNFGKKYAFINIMKNKN